MCDLTFSNEIGIAASEGYTEIETIVAVNEQGDVVSPCGMCREVISDLLYRKTLK